jgi:hypothetical protein
MGSAGMMIGAFAVASVVPAVVRALVAGGSRVAGFVALVGLVLPTLVLMFWATLRLFRAFARMLPGFH